MAYRDFVSISQLEDQFGIVQNRTRLFEGVAPVAASETLRNELYESASLPLMTEKAKSEFLIAPIVKEVRRHNQEEGLAQAGASMLAAALFNERKGTSQPAIYGCVTTAYDGPTLRWVLLRLNDAILDIDITQRYSLEEHSLPYLLGVMQHIVVQFVG